MFWIPHTQELAKGFGKLGDNVVIGSRKAVAKGTATDAKEDANKAALIKDFGLLTFAEAAKQGDIVILAVKFDYIRSILDSIKDCCDNKLVIDTNNPLKFVKGKKFPLELNTEVLKDDKSAGELAQNILSKSNVVKCWNIVGHEYMCDANPGGNTFLQNPTMIICGNNEEAKKTVSQILDTFGWKDILDVGGIDMSNHLESMCFLWCARIFLKGERDHNWSQMLPQKKDDDKK